MGRHGVVPESLAHSPFALAEAEAAGLTRGQLRGGKWQRIGVGQFMLAGGQATARHRVQMARRRLPDGAVFSGLTAAWLHGLDAKLATDIEATAPLEIKARSRSGMALHRAGLAADEVIQIRGLPVTSLLRTLRDLCTHSSLTESVVVIDAALHLRRTNLEALERYITARPGTRGIATMRRALVHAEPKAESPMESRMRMMCVLAGLPRPEAQVNILDAAGRVVGRPDLYYRDAHLAIEYDGETHNGSLAQDNHRQNLLIDCGLRILRFTAVDIYQHPQDAIAQIRRLLARS